MRTLNTLGAAALGLLTTCNKPVEEHRDPKPVVQRAPIVSKACEEFRAALAAEALLEGLAQDPHGRRKLLGLEDEMYRDLRKRTLDIMRLVEDPIACVREGQE